jgi:hypothetical protein
MRSLPGVVVATTALILVRELFQQFEAYQLIVYGGLVVVVILVAPDGLAGLGNRVKRAIARARSSRAPRPTVQGLDPVLSTDREGD